MAYDGDDAGKLVGRSILANDIDGLHEVSNRINTGHEIVKQWVEENGGKIISGGGDEGTFVIPVEAAEHIEVLRKDYQYATKLTMTVGVGKTLSEAGKALMAGKVRGKNMVVQYDESVEQELATAKEHMDQGSASGEEKKIGEAYLKNEQGSLDHSDCPHCLEYDQNNGGDALAQSEHSHDGCELCAEYDAKQGAGTDDHSDCPHCQEYDAKQAEGHSHDGCELCAEYDAKQGVAPADQAPEQAAAAPEQEAPPAPAPEGTGIVPQEAMSPQAPAEQQQIPENANTPAAMSAIAQQIASSTPASQNQATVDQIDSTDLAVGDDMEDNVSRPAGYDENVPGDMGLAEDQVPEEGPDLGQVLQSGIDSHADSIQREKVVQMVSEALEGFKSQKQILERAKEQAPQLYQSTIAMLKAMIEMAKMLGLGQEGSEGSAGPIEEQGTEVTGEAPSEENEWHDPFPTHPDNQAAAQGDAAGAPKAVRQ